MEEKTTQPDVPTSFASTNMPRLTRSETDRMIAGVAGGLGEYFHIDSTLIRLLFILVTIFGGSGILIYIILWIVIPSKSCCVGVSSDEAIKENVEEIKEKAQHVASDFQKTAKDGNSRMLWGIFIVALGILFLFNNFNIFSFLSFAKLWPVVFIVLGLAILLKKQ